MNSYIQKWFLGSVEDRESSHRFHEQLSMLCIARLVVLFTLLITVVIQQVIHPENLKDSRAFISYLFVFSGFLFNSIASVTLNQFSSSRVALALHILFDSFLIALWIFFADGEHSLFPLMYLIQILIVALTFHQKGALFSAVAAIFSFGIVNFSYPHENTLLTFIIYSMTFLFLGVVGGYLSEELLRANLSLKEKNRKIDELNALYEKIISEMPTGLLTVDGDTIIRFINPMGEHILGKSSRNIIGKKIKDVEADLLPFFEKLESENFESFEEQNTETEAALSSSHGELYRSVFLKGKSKKSTKRLQQTVEVGRGVSVRFLRGDVAELAEGFLGNGGRRVLLFQDVTRVIQLEDKLKQNEKLAAVGQLAAGIAHEIRNPLAGVSASIEMLKSSLPKEELTLDNHKLMEIALKEIDRLNELITEFLDFVKPEQLKLKPCDLGELLSSVVLNVKQTKENKKIIWEEHYQKNTMTLISAEKIKQVVFNLVVNATHAVAASGVIKVNCKNLTAHTVHFIIEDTGHGMSEEVQKHLYEPFFTTKPRGTGLGLATSYKIIEAHHGQITVRSHLGKGTAFEVVLPRA